MHNHFFILALLLCGFNAQGQVLHFEAVQQNDTSSLIKTHKLPALPMTFGYREPMKKAVPLDFYTQNFGFFCKQELKMQKAHVPLTFRLGSREYTDMLEQKNCH